MDGDPNLAAAIEAIWQRHRDVIFARMATIDAAIDAASRGGLAADVRASAHRDAHKLAGSLGTFGLHEGTACGRKLELAFAGADPLDVNDLRDAARGLRAQIESR